MVKVGLWVRLEAKPDKADELASFLEAGQALAENEPLTVAWFAVRLGPTTFGVFDAFAAEEGRQAHLDGEIAAALMAQADALLAAPPKIERHDVLGVKLP